MCGKVLASQASRAEPSADLVFCSKMPSARERISCYDAAARIAATSRQPTIAVAPVAAKSPSLAPEGPAVVIDVPRFQGFYAALGGSYGLGAPFNFSVFDTLQFFQGTASPHGASFVGSLGYNLQISHAVVGVEFSGRFGQEHFAASNTATVNDPLGIIGTSTASYAFNVDSSVHAALRAGLAVNDTLLFAKAGAGIAHFSQTATSQGAATNCQTINFNTNPISCVLRQPIVLGHALSQSGWLPSLLFGLGIEHNFGPFFGRIEAEAEATSRFTTSPDLFWSARAMAAVGVRL